jgi:hypothetical protein
VEDSGVEPATLGIVIECVPLINFARRQLHLRGEVHVALSEEIVVVFLAAAKEVVDVHAVAHCADRPDRADGGKGRTVLRQINNRRV